MTNQPNITRQLRAAVVDWLFEVGSKLEIEDKTVLFEAVNLMDRFYDLTNEVLPSKDLQLTAVTSLFLASKNLEVDPLDLNTCVKTLCFNKYSRQQFLQKESVVQKLTMFENESPSVLDFIMFYLRLIKSKLQSSINCLESTSDFLLDVQTIAYDLCKSILIDASMLKYRPSVLGATTIYLGFQLQFDLMMMNKLLEIKSFEGRKKVGQISLTFRIWIDLLENKLAMEDVPKIEQFCEHVFSRQLQLFIEYKNQFCNIYKERCYDYFVEAPAKKEPCSKTQSSPVRSN